MEHRNCEICGLRTSRTEYTKRYFMARFPLDEARCKLWVKMTGKEDLAYVSIEKIHEMPSLSLLLECGLIRPSGAGLFTLLPLARRALNKLEALVRTCFDDCGAQEICMSTLTSAAVWQRSGRLEGAATELLTVQDRHRTQYLLSPTFEEPVTELLADLGPLSYKQLPLLLYQIGNKYRDERRPKHGLLRAREFLMADMYSAHASEQSARDTYRALTAAYRRLFRLLRLPVHRVVAPSGEMGGSMSHEWQLCAAAGEDAVCVCAECGRAYLPPGLAPCRCGARGGAEPRPAVEVGHTFLLGARYSRPLAATFVAQDGATAPLVMASYGIGITRLLAASVESLSTETSLRWAAGLAPYSLCLIGPKEGSREWAALGGAEGVRAVARALGGDLLVDDRHHLTVGKRLLQADRMGYPVVVVAGRGVAETPPRAEVVRPGAAPLLCSLPDLPALCRDLLRDHTDHHDHTHHHDDDLADSN